MNKFVLRLEKSMKSIEKSDHILIGAGSGLSSAAGILYSGKRFTDNFKDFIEKYDFKDLYTSSFYPFKTSNEKWAYWARHINLNRYSVGKTRVYEKLLKLVKNKDYFILTTNVEHQFWINEFEDKRIFATQGDYGLFQCSMACHDKLYDNKLQIKEMLKETINCKIPTELIPKCPVCGNEMDINIRKDNNFVEDKKWYEMKKNYSEFLKKITCKNVVLLEIGVGFNTPGIIRYPFERLTYENPNATLIRINPDYPNAIEENKNKTISFDENTEEILNYWISGL